jgi:hypothetical protein
MAGMTSFQALESEWDGDVAVATWTPSPDHAAGPRHLVNGGIIDERRTTLDCVLAAAGKDRARAGRNT